MIRIFLLHTVIPQRMRVSCISIGIKEHVVCRFMEKVWQAALPGAGQCRQDDAAAHAQG